MIERIGILGGGQLAQMLAQAAVSFGMGVVVFEREADSPASRLTPHSVVGAWDDVAALERFASLAQLVTLENEFVDAGVLARLESWGLPVFPSSHTLGLIQDKLVQKRRLQQVGLPVAPFRAVDSPAEVRAAAAAHDWPLLLKARRDGYDGRGNATLHGPDTLAAAWERLGGHAGRQLYVEAFVHFEAELALMVARARSGETRCYPVVATEQRNHICHRVLAPALIDPSLACSAAELARSAVEAVGGVGIFGVELFLTQTGILINELAPRPHNSGHYTIEACATSQFENHLRAVLGLPLGSTAMRAPAAVMVNLLGSRSGPFSAGDQPPYSAALSVPGAHLHLYGKRQLRPGRKLGHVTALGATLAEAAAIAEQAAALVDM
jgi:5-(carboxyamino)imidazole ribonucleotide synthase